MTWYESLTSTPAAIAAGALGIAALYAASRTPIDTGKTKPASKMAQTSIMSPPVVNLAPPKDDPITPADLSQYDGTDASKPIYVAIKGKVFDVTNKKEMYGVGGGYHVFAGKDASKGLGMSSLEAKDAVSDYSELDATQRKTLDQWEAFFEKRYNIVGKVKL